MNAPSDIIKVLASTPDATMGYRAFTLGSFNFRRDEYFAHITWTTRDGRPLSHTMDIGNFLRALMRDVAWGFFYGWVNFDNVLGTVNHYQSVDLYAGSYNGTMKAAGVDLLENFPTDQIRATFEQMLDDWTNETFDPFSAPQETGTPYGRKNGNNNAKITRARELATRCVGLKGDLNLRTDARGAPINRAFADVPQDMPELHPSPVLKTKCMPSTCLRFYPAAKSLGTRVSHLWSSTATCARPPKNTSCPSFMAMTASNGSSRCAMKSTGIAQTKTPANRWRGSS